MLKYNIRTILVCRLHDNTTHNPSLYTNFRLVNIKIYLQVRHVYIIHIMYYNLYHGTTQGESSRRSQIQMDDDHCDDIRYWQVNSRDKPNVVHYWCNCSWRFMLYICRLQHSTLDIYRLDSTYIYMLLCSVVRRGGIRFSWAARSVAHFCFVQHKSISEMSYYYCIIIIAVVNIPFLGGQHKGYRIMNHETPYSSWQQSRLPKVVSHKDKVATDLSHNARIYNIYDIPTTILTHDTAINCPVIISVHKLPSELANNIIVRNCGALSLYCTLFDFHRQG